MAFLDPVNGSDGPAWRSMDRQQHIWRYMRLERYLQILEDSAISFVSSTRMEDVWEGARLYPDPAAIADPADRRLQEVYNGLLAADQEWIRRSTYLSCWHAAEAESAGMWDLYAKRDAGIALHTLWGALIDNLEAHSGRNFYGGRVKYMDYVIERPSITAVMGAFFAKRASFQHEREARLAHFPGFIAPVEEWLSTRWMTEKTDWPDVIPRKLGLPSLKAHILVSPTAPQLFVERVEQETRKHGCSWPVSRSTLYDPPPVPPATS